MHQGQLRNDAVEAAVPRIKPRWRAKGKGVFYFHLNDTNEEETDSETLWDNVNRNYNYLTPPVKQ